MLVGGCCIDDVRAVAVGLSRRAVLPFAPWWRRRLLGTFLRSFTFGHVRQLDKAAELGLRAGVVCGRGA